MEGRDRMALGLFLATVVATVLVVGLVVANAGDDGPVNRAPTEPPPCVGDVDRGVLPKWARTGFSDPEPRMPHVIGRRGELAAVLFGEPLVAPTDPDRSNKILWVARETPEPGPLRLVGTAGSRTVTRVVESGPGPSIVDLPAGCWSVLATWSGGHDELDLRYVPGRTARRGTGEVCMIDVVVWP
jgi:hypothetical protein